MSSINFPFSGDVSIRFFGFFATNLSSLWLINEKQAEIVLCLVTRFLI